MFYTDISSEALRTSYRDSYEPAETGPRDIGRHDQSPRPSRRHLNATPEHRRLLMHISQSYYFENKSKVEIAELYSISRFKVARYLEEALRLGIVSIAINAGASLPELGDQLRHHLQLHQGHVIEIYGDDATVREAIGRAAGTYLVDSLGQGEILGVSWGPVLDSLPKEFEQLRSGDEIDPLSPAEILELTGRPEGDHHGPVRLMNHLAGLTDAPVRTLPAPFFVEDARQAAALRHQPDIAACLTDFSRLTTAVVCVEPPPLSATGMYADVPDRFIQRIQNSQAVAEVGGNLFCRDGCPVEIKLQRHTLGITTNQLRHVPRVILVGAGVRQAQAVRAFCCSGIPTDLIVDVELAKALLHLPRVTEKALGRN